MKLHSVSSDVTEPPAHSFKKMHRQRGGLSAEPPQVPVLLLDENGMIKDCSKSVERLFGYHAAPIQQVCILYWEPLLFPP